MIITKILAGIGILVVLELISYGIVVFYRSKFPWLIIKRKDNIPEIDKELIEKKFFREGYDKELGWCRKPNTTGHDKIFCKLDGKWGYKKSTWSINKKGSRKNPGHENLDDSLISCYGDSFIFERQVNDNETWKYELSKRLKINILNFGVGNYGLDQALLRLEREFPKNPTKIVIMGVVPDTICRVVSYWKHFYEYGNIWAFKPRFEIKKGKLELIPNLMDKQEKFFELDKHIDELRKHDYFYKNKFKKEIIGFPYFLSILKNPKRNFSIILSVKKQLIMHFFSQKARTAKPVDTPTMDIIRNINLKWAVKLYKNKYSVKLMEKLIGRFIADGKKLNFKPIFVFLPQKNEVLYNAEKDKKPFYIDFFKKISKKVETIDVSTPLLNHPDIDSLYSEKSDYGAHYSPKGNSFIAKIIYEELKKEKLI